MKIKKVTAADIERIFRARGITGVDGISFKSIADGVNDVVDPVRQVATLDVKGVGENGVNIYVKDIPVTNRMLEPFVDSSDLASVVAKGYGIIRVTEVSFGTQIWKG